MASTENKKITVSVSIKAPVEKVWETWTNPVHIERWNRATDEWHTPKATNDLRVGGKFIWRMEAKDGSAGFDFTGEYTALTPHRLIEYVLEDGRKVSIQFIETNGETQVTEIFEAEAIHPAELQQAGWQAILNNFKTHTEAFAKLQRLRFEIKIDAPAEKVYQIMLNDKHYREWTAEFNPSSYYEGTWDKGSRIRFIGTDENGNRGGMVSLIRENIPNRLVSIEHLGIIKGNEEITNGPEVEGWAGAQENYTYTEKDGKTLLVVEIDSNEEFKTYFSDTYPRALNKLKEICLSASA